MSNPEKRLPDRLRALARLGIWTSDSSEPRGDKRMDVHRRDILSGFVGIAASGGALGSSSTANARESRTTPAVATSLSGELPYMTRPPMDRARATEVLTRLGLDGLLVCDPVNVYYLTGLDSTHFMRSLMLEPSVFAFVPRREREPVSLVMPSSGYYNGFSAVHSAWRLAVFQYGPEGTMYPDRGEVPLDALERQRAARVAAQRSEYGIADSAGDALRSAGRELGLLGGRIAVDVEPGTRLWSTIQDCLGSARLQSADEALGRMRLVKSSTELAFMRYAARANAEAARVACRTVRDGATHRELRSTFFAEAARRGGQGAWINIDRVVADAYRGEFRRGQAFMIDAVSRYGGYHGDYGRTVFVDEPAKGMRRHTDAIVHAWRAVREQLRPGVTFSQIVEMGQAALKKGGFGTGVRITPHSIGILHTDTRGLGDVTLEPGMVLSVDFPVLDGGIGGSAHLEDLTVITPGGCELLNDAAEPTIQI